MSAVFSDDSVAHIDAKFRLMEEADLDEVMAIETAVYPYPWTRGIFFDCLKIGYLCLVLEQDKKIVAYAVLSIALSIKEAHLLTIVVPTEKQNKGYGKIILNEMIRLAKTDDIKTMYLEVRVSNTKASQIYQNRGFNELGIRDNYYPAEQGREDALIFALDLSFE
ncbi:MAG: ribosomal protein S18-alanine N-acetyltransferase [Woeseiaceae bacterium]